MGPSQPTEDFALYTIVTSRDQKLRSCSITMRIAWGGSLRSTPPSFRRRGDGAQRGGTENFVVDGSSLAVGLLAKLCRCGP